MNSCGDGKLQTGEDCDKIMRWHLEDRVLAYGNKTAVLIEVSRANTASLTLVRRF